MIRTKNFTIILLALGLSAPALATDSPLDVGDRAQLFVDRLLVRDAEGVSFTQHPGQKHPDNPIISPDQPWEGWRTYVYGSVLYDQQEQRFKLWYLAVGDRSDFFDQEHLKQGGVTCYATSRDGIHWDKPLVGTEPSKTGQGHNVVTAHHLASVIKDQDDPDPDRRFKMIAFRHVPHGEATRRGYHTLVSPDGIRWKPLSQAPISPAADVITGYWDAGRQLYVAFPKTGRSWRGHGRRLFSTITSQDFVTWTEPVLSWTTDLRDDAGSLARIERVRPVLDQPDDPKLMRTEYYGIGVYQAESCTIGFPWMLTVNNKTRWENNADGPMEVQLAVSRDLMNWERPFRTPVIPYGELDAWDAATHMTAAEAIRVGDEIRLYYGGGNMTHGCPAYYVEEENGGSTGRGTRFSTHIGLVTWKLDRFVSVDGPAEGGTMTTVPITFSGQRLEINAAIGDTGSIVVRLCDAAGRTLADFPASQPLRGDDLRHVVRFGDQAYLSRLAGKPISLRFEIQDGQLYSFAFRG